MVKSFTDSRMFFSSSITKVQFIYKFSDPQERFTVSLRKIVSRDCYEK